MHIKKLEIKKFRRFENTDIKLGTNITCLAGHNAVGKSTLLGLLGHCGEYKKQDGETLLGQYFKADLSEIIKFSKEFDPPGSNLFTIFFENLPDEDDENQYSNTLSFRTTWQTQKDRQRYRILPMKQHDRNIERKIKWPTFYLGLSRLYPLGEANGIKQDKHVNRLSEEDLHFIFVNYRQILTSNDNYTEITSFSLSEIQKKKSIGVNTDFYDYLSNSSGQDNLGQILIAILSFKKIKENDPTNWNGGLLLIDEIDATLHPAAQNKLFDFLFKQSKQLGIQIVFTTHSLSLLEHIHTKNQYNQNTTNNPIEVCYLTTANERLVALPNPSMDSIYYDLMATYHDLVPSPKIIVYSEDDETRWFLKKMFDFAKEQRLISDNIVNRIMDSLNFLDVKLGCNQLLTLLSQDVNYFGKCIMLFDGDVPERDITKKLSKVPIKYSELNYTQNEVIIKLPCNMSPEQLLWDYLNNLDDDSGFFTYDLFSLGYTKRNLILNGPFNNELFSGKDREKYKQWFNKNISILESLVNFWFQENQETVIDFLKRFEIIYNVAARKNKMLPVNYSHALQNTTSNQESSEINI
ncbi:ATP-dependent nuclease [Bacillus toyonensis]|uniref:ATP-dependent nuclease n=1 Tax=Bacillus toyonensis TaxID=155322 RepID=UPI000BF354F5|nr:AAA family ATPase [Bacillus toyonensis]PFY08597.1 hypothetical protein COL43_11860 [Bacillus toyonensis]PGC07832.1 hypothetical protein COM20_07405 [Bacillus toyonensis]